LKPTHLLVSALVLCGLAAPLAGARSEYLIQLQAQYHLEQDATANQAGCQYCHVNRFGGAGWNKFGTEVRTALAGQARGQIKDALYLVLKADKDSDGDGYADALEVVAKTLPGDAASKPAQTEAALRAQLTRLGGVDYFSGTVTGTATGTRTTTATGTANGTATGTTTGAMTTTTTATAATIRNFAFTPATIRVRVGETVTWTNQDAVGHTVTSEMGGELNSPLLRQGQSYSHTFTRAGTYPYLCAPHPNMRGVVVVTQ
jgi:amicyanin